MACAEDAIAAAEDAPAPADELAEVPAGFGAGLVAAGACAWSPEGTGVTVPAGLAGRAGTAAAGTAGETFGITGLGAATPAISEPNPNFWSVGASSLPVASMLFDDWNFWTAAMVSASHFPVGSPL